MSRHATAEFTVKSWDEEPHDEVDGGPKLTRASVTRTFAWDIGYVEASFDIGMVPIHASTWGQVKASLG